MQKRRNSMKKVIGILLVLLVTTMVFGASSELELAARVKSSHGLLLSITEITNIPEFNHELHEGGVDLLDFGTLDMDSTGFIASLTKNFYIAFKSNDKFDTSIALSGSPLASDNESDPKIGYSIVTETGNSEYYTPVAGGTLTVTKEDESDVTTTVGTFAGRNGMKADSAKAIVTLTENDVVHAAQNTYSTTITVEIVSGA
jgi:hypothetical protein